MRRREKALERECFRERVVNSVCDEKNRRNQEVPRQNRPCFYSLYGFVLCIFNFNYFFGEKIESSRIPWNLVAVDEGGRRHVAGVCLDFLRWVRENSATTG